MVRSRIGAPPSEATVTLDDAVEGTDGQPPPPGWRDAPTCATETLLGGLVERLGAICASAADTVRRAVTNGSVTLGCLLALGGGCGEAATRVEVAGVVIDDASGAPIAGARVSTEDGFSAETDDDGRFELSVEEGENRVLSATATGHAPLEQRVDARAGAAEVVLRMRAVRSATPVDADAVAEPRADLPALALSDDAKLQVEACADCHADVAAEWARSSMSDVSFGPRGEDPARRAECASCHTAQGFVGRPLAPTEPAAITCGGCHEPHRDDGAFGLRVDDVSPPIAGATVPHLGSGALCASCHRADGDAIDDAPHAPQGDMLVGRGARTAAPMDDGSHRHIADTCARCHMSEAHESDLDHEGVGGHTFAVRGADTAVARGACAPCHGELEPTRIGARDWNGDGVAGALSEEHATAIRRVHTTIRDRIVALDINDSCDATGPAADVVDHATRIHLVDAEGALLGDCDGDRRIGDGEIAHTTRALPADLAAASYDVLLLRRDGSAGAHNPGYAFRVLEGIASTLR